MNSFEGVHDCPIDVEKHDLAAAQTDHQVLAVGHHSDGVHIVAYVDCALEIWWSTRVDLPELHSLIVRTADEAPGWQDRQRLTHFLVRRKGALTRAVEPHGDAPVRRVLRGGPSVQYDA